MIEINKVICFRLCLTSTMIAAIFYNEFNYAVKDFIKSMIDSIKIHLIRAYYFQSY